MQDEHSAPPTAITFLMVDLQGFPLIFWGRGGVQLQSNLKWLVPNTMYFKIDHAFMHCTVFIQSGLLLLMHSLDVFMTFMNKQGKREFLRFVYAVLTNVTSCDHNFFVTIHC